MTDCYIKRDVLDYGYVILHEYSGSDEKIDKRARMSTDGRQTSTVRKLLRHLMRCRHTSPFELADFTFEIKCPIHVARQWHRHRTASINEVSARYTTLPSEMYVPRPEHIFSKKHDDKQGRGGYLSEGQKLKAAFEIEDGNAVAYDMYEHLLAGDIAPELARGNLPLNTYTKFYWDNDLHNTMHFLNLRCDSHAQWEIRQYANAMESIISPLFPLSMEAWGDYIFRSHTLSRWAMAAVQDIIQGLAHPKPMHLTEKWLQHNINQVHSEYVPKHLTEREWKEDVLPVTEARF